MRILRVSTYGQKKKESSHLYKRLRGLKEVLSALWPRALLVPIDDRLIRNAILVVQHLERILILTVHAR